MCQKPQDFLHRLFVTLFIIILFCHTFPVFCSFAEWSLISPWMHQVFHQPLGMLGLMLMSQKQNRNPSRISREETTTHRGHCTELGLRMYSLNIILMRYILPVTTDGIKWNACQYRIIQMDDIWPDIKFSYQCHLLSLYYFICVSIKCNNQGTMAASSSQCWLWRRKHGIAAI